MLQKPTNNTPVPTLVCKLNWCDSFVVTNMRNPKSWPVLLHPRDEGLDGVRVAKNKLVQETWEVDWFVVPRVHLFITLASSPDEVSLSEWQKSKTSNCQLVHIRFMDLDRLLRGDIIDQSPDCHRVRQDGDNLHTVHGVLRVVVAVTQNRRHCLLLKEVQMSLPLHVEEDEVLKHQAVLVLGLL